jgi:hypothetical protein
MTHQTTENLTQAAQAAGFPVSSLRDALKGASAVQGLAILALIDRAATLQRDIEALRAAVAEDCRNTPEAQAARDAAAYGNRIGAITLGAA